MGIGIHGAPRERTILRAFEITTNRVFKPVEWSSRWANPTRCPPPVTTTRTTKIFRRIYTHRSAMKPLARILDKTVGLPQTSRTGFWNGSTFPQGRPCSMLLVEQGARRCESPLARAVLSSALTFTNRRLPRRAHWQPSAAWPGAPTLGLLTLRGLCH